MRESRQPLKNWIPAFAGMTNSVVFDLKKIKPIGKRYHLLEWPTGIPGHGAVEPHRDPPCWMPCGRFGKVMVSTLEQVEVPVVIIDHRLSPIQVGDRLLRWPGAARGAPDLTLNNENTRDYVL